MTPQEIKQEIDSHEHCHGNEQDVIMVAGNETAEIYDVPGSLLVSEDYVTAKTTGMKIAVALVERVQLRVNPEAAGLLRHIATR